MTLLVATLPWLFLLVLLPLFLRRTPALSSRPTGLLEGAPTVSVILPTHDDAARVGACLATLLDSGYPAYEVLVVDDGSRDGTREIVAALEERAPTRVRLVDPGDVPAGRSWRGWACAAGARSAQGEVLLFTDPATHHESALLPRAVAVLEGEEAQLLGVLPRLVMHGFWERLVMPHVWLVLRARLPTAARVNRRRHPAEAMATRHFLLIRRTVYEALGGHGAIEEAGAEEVRLARAAVAAGHRLVLLHGEALLEARVYRGYGEIAADLRTLAPLATWAPLPRWARAIAAWVLVLLPVLLFVLPPATLVASLLGLVGGAAARWALLPTAASLLFWLVVYARHRIRPAYAVAYPAGALLGSLAMAQAILNER
jgi:hypothetical protein